MREAASLREERVRNIVVREEEDGYYKTLKNGGGTEGEFGKEEKCARLGPFD
jgi:hypothetical protein